MCSEWDTLCVAFGFLIWTKEELSSDTQQHKEDSFETFDQVSLNNVILNHCPCINTFEWCL